MTRDRNGLPDVVLTPLRSTWEDTVAAGLRQASDVELLWMLDEIEAQLGERAAPFAGRPLAGDSLLEASDDIPDWDDKSPEELAAIVADLEAVPAGLDERQRPEKPHLLRRRLRGAPDAGPARLRCEELEPRFPPSVTLLPRFAPSFGASLASAWAEDRVMAASASDSFTGEIALAASAEDAVEGLACALVA